MTAELSLMSRIEARIDSGGVELPPANQVITRLRAVTANPDFDINEVVELVSSDQVLTAEILRVANGAFYGLTSLKQILRWDDAGRLAAAGCRVRDWPNGQLRDMIAEWLDYQID